MSHYVCTGTCGGVSDKPKNCGTPDCPMHGKPLTECDCKNGKHAEVREEERLEEEIEEKSGE